VADRVPTSTDTPPSREALEQQIVDLKQEVWIARDAAIGATAELGTARAHVVELESLVHQLRSELAAHDAMIRSRSYRLATRLNRPARVVRRYLG
jgi:hypothetical protein